jgi:hypothetical protein
LRKKLLFHFNLLFSRIQQYVGVGNLDQIPPVQFAEWTMLLGHLNKTKLGTASGPHQMMAFCSKAMPRDFAASNASPSARKLGSPGQSPDGCCPTPSMKLKLLRFSSADNSLWRFTLSVSLSCLLKGLQAVTKAAQDTFFALYRAANLEFGTPTLSTKEESCVTRYSVSL